MAMAYQKYLDEDRINKTFKRIKNSIKTFIKDICTHGCSTGEFAKRIREMSSQLFVCRDWDI